MKEQNEPEHCFYIVKDHLPIPEKGTHQDVALAVSNQTKTYKFLII